MGSDASKEELNDINKIQDEFRALSITDCQGMIDASATREMYKKRNEKAKRKIEERMQDFIPVRGPGNNDINNLNIILLGKSGSGKSTLGNLLLGSDEFKEAAGAGSGTTEMLVGKTVVNGIKVRVIDTPGSMDHVISPEDIAIEMLKVAMELKEGIHAFIFVRSMGNTRFTSEEVKAFKYIEDIYSKGALDRCIFAWSHAHKILQLKGLEDKTIDGYREHSLEASNTSQDFLKEISGIYRSVGNRIVGVENVTVSPYEKEKQREQLFSYLLSTVAGPHTESYVSPSMKNVHMRYKEIIGQDEDDQCREDIAKYLRTKRYNEIVEICRGIKPGDIPKTQASDDAKQKELLAQAQILTDVELLNGIGKFAISLFTAAGLVLKTLSEILWK